jgi:hypothetical protein
MMILQVDAKNDEGMMILQVDAKNGEGDKGAYLCKHEPLCSNEEQSKRQNKRSYILLQRSYVFD